MTEDKKIILYKTWAPIFSPWSAWVKPAIFASMNYQDYKGDYISYFPNLEWAEKLDKQTAVIVDLPGKSGLIEAMSLAKIGMRPVPLYNGCRTSSDINMIVNVSDITKLLYTFAEEINRLRIQDDALPVFILDSRRMETFSKIPGKFDNRWCVFAQDMPSGKYLRNAGVNTILVRTDYIRNDLSHILVRYQQEGIKIKICSDGNLIKDTTVHKPSRFRSLLYRTLVMMRLTRNSTGGFGGIIPEPMEHNSGVGYYGLG